MRIEIFVVTTELDKLNETLKQKNLDLKSHLKIIKQVRTSELKLFKCKSDLIKLFGGLTEFNNLKGHWINAKGKNELDMIDIWLIYTAQREEELNNILLRIKEITKQKSQAYAINNEIYFI